MWIKGKSDFQSVELPNWVSSSLKNMQAANFERQSCERDMSDVKPNGKGRLEACANNQACHWEALKKMIFHPLGKPH